jgi:hypothetical protein
MVCDGSLACNNAVCIYVGTERTSMSITLLRARKDSRSWAYATIGVIFLFRNVEILLGTDCARRMVRKKTCPDVRCSSCGPHRCVENGVIRKTETHHRFAEPSSSKARVSGRWESEVNAAADVPASEASPVLYLIKR